MTGVRACQQLQERTHTCAADDPEAVCMVPQDGSTRSLSLLLAANPSHLEAVTPVVLGMVRGAQQQLQEGAQAPGTPPCSSRAAAVVVHGDAAFAGLGLAAESLQLGSLPGRLPSRAAQLV